MIKNTKKLQACKNSKNKHEAFKNKKIKLI